MASNIIPKSLTRINSRRNLTVFIVVETKPNDELLIISRDKLAPSLQTGHINLNQKVHMILDDGDLIEGKIVYMHHDRENCVKMRKDLIETRKRQEKNYANQSINTPDDTISSTCKSQITILKKSSNDSTKEISRTQNKKNLNEKSKNSTILDCTSISYEFNEDDDTCGGTEYSLCSGKKSNSTQNMNTLLDDTIQASSIMIDNNVNERTNENDNDDYNRSDNDNHINNDSHNDNENNMYTTKINELADEVKQLKATIQKQNAEIKRLRQTMIEMPQDVATQDFLIRFADQIRYNTSGHKFNGNLIKEAKTLGINVAQLSKALKPGVSITKVAREIFQAIVPEERRHVDHWNKLDQDVLFKEQLLIEFLERYYGLLQVNSATIHKSLVGCIRNQRNTKKNNHRKHKYKKIM